MRQDGFLFDMGPSWYMMPEIFERYFAQFGKQTTDYYKLIKLNPRYRVYHEGQRPIDLNQDISENIKLFESIEPGSGKKLQHFLNTNQTVYEIATRELLFEDFLSLGDAVKLSKIADLFRIITLINPFQSWHSYVAAHFQNPRLQQILEFPAVFLGGDPYHTPALYSILIWADFGKKIWYPMGGMTKVIEALAMLNNELGVSIHLDQPVQKIIVRNNRAAGIVVDGQEKTYDIVVAATDAAHIDLDLLAPDNQMGNAQKWNQKKLAISALLLYLGLDTKVPNSVHHSLYFSKDWNHHFDTIRSSDAVPENPNFYLSIPSVTDRAVAPQGKENLFILVPLGAKQQTISVKDQDNIIKHVSQVIGFPLKPHIIVRKTLDPAGFSSLFNAYKGTALGLAHTLDQSLFLRPKNRSSKITNLYLAGQYTNPGVGVPMALISAEIVAKRIEKDND
jgi:phytoene desaturase